MTTTRYSIFALLRNALGYHANWPAAWHSPQPRRTYDVVVIGGGGHGLATAYYLARNHGVTDVAVLEKGWIGGGNTGRNTATIRSNYLRDESIRFFHRSLKLYETLSRELNFNVMFSQRGQVDLIQTYAKLRDLQRRSQAMALHGIPYEIIEPARIRRIVPDLNLAPAGLPVLAGAWHPQAGIARHDAVAWGYARQADARGVDIIQQCEVTGIHREGDTVTGVETTKGVLRARKVAVATAGHAGVLAAMAGFRLPIETLPLLAFVSEPVKPILDVCVNCPAMHVYLSQSDKGELVIGGGPDGFRSYAQRGDYAVMEQITAGLIELFPRFRGLRLMRQWAGMIDLCYDTSPIVSKTPLRNLYFSVGWGSGGFKAIPAGGEAFAELIVRDEPNALIAPFSLDRFTRGRLVLESAGASNRE